MEEGIKNIFHTCLLKGKNLVPEFQTQNATMQGDLKISYACLLLLTVLTATPWLLIFR